MSEGFCARASPSQTLQSGFSLSSQSIKHTLKTDDEWFFGQEPQRFTEQNFRLFPIPRHHGWLRSKIVRILVAWVLGSPRLDLFPRQIELSTPDIDLNDALTDLPPGIKGSSSLIHSTSVIKHSDVRQNRSQSGCKHEAGYSAEECPPQFCNRFKMLKVLGGSHNRKALATRPPGKSESSLPARDGSETPPSATGWVDRTRSDASAHKRKGGMSKGESGISSDRVDQVLGRVVQQRGIAGRAKPVAAHEFRIS
jgi:hypothetical protein